MAATATRMLLLRNGKSFPFHFLRCGRPLGASSGKTSLALQGSQTPVSPQYFLGDQQPSCVVPPLGADTNAPPHKRFFGGEVDRLELARGRKDVVRDDEEMIEDEGGLDGEEHIDDLEPSNIDYDEVEKLLDELDKDDDDDDDEL